MVIAVVVWHRCSTSWNSDTRQPENHWNTNMIKRWFKEKGILGRTVFVDLQDALNHLRRIPSRTPRIVVYRRWQYRCALRVKMLHGKVKRSVLRCFLSSRMYSIYRKFLVGALHRIYHIGMYYMYHKFLLGGLYQTHLCLVDTKYRHARDVFWPVVRFSG